MIYFIDTNIIIDFLRQKNDELILFFQKIKNGEIEGCISVITEYEFLAVKKKNAKQILLIEELLKIFNTIPVNSKIAKIAADLYQKYQTSFADNLIAASAVEMEAVLFTRDKGLSKIKELKTVDKV